MLETKRSKLIWITVGATVGAIISNVTDVFTTPALLTVYNWASGEPVSTDGTAQHIPDGNKGSPNEAQCAASPPPIVAGARMVFPTETPIGPRVFKEGGSRTYPTDGGEPLILSGGGITPEQLDELSSKMGEALAKRW